MPHGRFLVLKLTMFDYLQQTLSAVEKDSIFLAPALLAGISTLQLPVIRALDTRQGLGERPKQGVTRLAQEPSWHLVNSN